MQYQAACMRETGSDCFSDKQRVSAKRPAKVIAVITIILLFPLGYFANSGMARNPNPSNWMMFLSGSEPTSETVIQDQNQEIAVSGATVHVMWVVDGTNKSYLYYRRSIDGGATWEQARLLQTGYATWGSSHTNKRMAVDGTDVHIAITYNKGGRFYLNYFRSSDGGASFSSPVEYGPYTQSLHHISAAQGTVAMTIANNISGGVGTLIALISKDRGASFEPIAVQSVQGWQFNSGDVLVHAGRVYVLYLRPINDIDDVNPQELYFAATGADGRTFYQPQLISFAAKNRSDGRHYCSLNDSHYSPSIAADINYVYLVWSGADQHGGSGTWQYSVYFRRSDNYGATLGNAIALNQWSSEAGSLNALDTIAAAGGRVYVVYLAARGTSNTNVMLRRSDNNADSFFDAKTLHYTGWWPTVAVDPGDSTGKSVGILLSWPSILKTKDGGATWKGPQSMVPYQATYTAYYRPKLALGSNDAVHMVSEGVFSSGGDTDIVYRRVLPPANPGNNGALYLVSETSTEPGNLRRYDEMQVGMSPILSSLSGGITIECWLKPKRVDGYYNWPVSKFEPGSSFPVYAVGWQRDGKPEARINTAHGQFHVYGGEAISNDTWVHVAVTYNAAGQTGNFKLYQNGRMIGQQTASGQLKAGTGPLHVGSNNCEDNQSVAVDELRIWNKALSDSEVRDAMSKPMTGGESGLLAYYNFDNSTKDITGNGNDGILLCKESFVQGYFPPVTVIRNDFVGTWAGSGTYYRNSDTGEWVYLTSAASQILVGDMDGDGRDDLIGNWPGGGIYVKYASTGQWVRLASSADFITLTSFPGDQLPELVGIWSGTIYYRDGATGIWGVLEFGAGQVTFADLDGDNKPDLIGNWLSSGVWARYSKTGEWKKLGSVAQWITAGDYDGDGKNDLLGVWDSSIYVRDTATGNWTFISAGATQVLLGDLDGDKKQDLIGAWASGAWVKYSGTGSWFLLSSPPTSMAVGRFR